MSNKDAMKRFVGGLLITGLLLGGGGLALAATTNTGTDGQNNSIAPVCGSGFSDKHGMRGLNSDELQSVLDQLVADKTITQSQADQIMTEEKQAQSDRQNLKGQMETMKEKFKNMTQDERKTYLEENKTQKVDMFSQLVKEGTITQDQADEIIKAFQDKIAAERQTELKTALTGLVDKNVIDNEQMTAVLDQLNESKTDRQNQLDTFKDMTPEQRQAYFKANQPAKGNPLAELVSAGTITQAQADEIIKAIHGDGGRGMGMQKNHSQGGTSETGTSQTS